MKVRNDFVTNSSSANYVVEFQLKSDHDEMVSYEVRVSGSGDYEGSEPFEALFERGWIVKGLGLCTPCKRNGELILGGKPLSQLADIEDVAEALLNLVDLEFYDDSVIADGLRFFIVGEPVAYESRVDLEETLERMGASITNLLEADYIIYCDKDRFCTRWPHGYSYDAMDEAEQQELDSAEDAIRAEFRDADEAFHASRGIPDERRYHFDIFTAEHNGPWYANELGNWEGWSLWVQDDETNEIRYIPILAEREFAYFDPYGPAGNGALSTMPGAAETLTERCMEKGITRKNLRILGGKIHVEPFGDSVWEVSDYTDQWNINVPTGELRSTGEQVYRESGSLVGQGAIWTADNSWQDTIWWPFTGEANAVPYESVTAGAVRRSTVRYLDLSGINGLGLTSMRGLFKDFEDLQRLDPSVLDTSQVTDMGVMFEACLKLRSLDLSSLDTSQVTNMSWMFGRCRQLLTLDLAGIDTSQVRDMSGMFAGCESLSELDVSGFDTSRVTNLFEMFSYCRSLEQLDLSGWDTTQVTNMGYVFDDCHSLQALDLSGWNTSQVTSMRGLFNHCSSMERVDLSGFDTSHVNILERMFNGCSSLLELDVTGFDTSQVTDMRFMFWDCSKLHELDVSSFDTSKVTDMDGMFCFCERIKHLDLSSWDTSHARVMKWMFRGCTALRELDLSGFDTSQVTNTEDMFEDCVSLERWSVPATWPVNLPGAIPHPTADNDMWWSEHDDRWMTIEQIRSRGPMADTFTSTH